MSAFTFDGLDLSDGVTYTCRLVDTDPYGGPPPGHSFVPHELRPGGTLITRPPGMRMVTLGGTIQAASLTALETARDTLLRTLERPQRRLTTKQLADRFVVATLAEPVRVTVLGPRLATWAATFAAEDAYESALTPSGDVRTPALALLPGETVQRGVSYSLTPGGSAPVAPRWLVTNQAGGVTPLLWEVRNLANGQALALAEAVPAGSALLLDPQAGAYAGSLSSLVGFWPLADPTGSIQIADFSGQSRDLSENGTVSFRQDGPERFEAAVGFDGSASNYLSSTLAAFALTSTLSVTCWFRHTAGVGFTTHVLISKASNNQGYCLLYNAADFYWINGDGIGWNAAVWSGHGLEAGRWYFVAATTSAAAGRIRLYVGTHDQPPRLQAQASSVSMVSGTNNLVVGGGHNVSGGLQWPVNGRIAQPAVYNTELTADQVRRVWARGPQAYADRQIEWRGRFPELDPREGATNTVRLRADHSSTNPTPRIAAVWRSQYQ